MAIVGDRTISQPIKVQRCTLIPTSFLCGGNRFKIGGLLFRRRWRVHLLRPFERRWSASIPSFLPALQFQDRPGAALGRHGQQEFQGCFGHRVSVSLLAVAGVHPVHATPTQHLPQAFVFSAVTDC